MGRGGGRAVEMAWLRVGLGAVLFAPKRRFMVGRGGEGGWTAGRLDGWTAECVLCMCVCVCVRVCAWVAG